MAPVPMPEPPPMASEGTKTGRGDIQAKQAEEEKRVQIQRRGDGKEVRKREGERDDEECNQAFNTVLQVSVKTSDVCRSFQRKAEMVQEGPT